MKELGNTDKQEVGRWANNRVENSHLPFRRRERAMLRFRRMKTLQKFASVHANVHNHFNLERHLVDRQTYKERRSAALATGKFSRASPARASRTFVGGFESWCSLRCLSGMNLKAILAVATVLLSALAAACWFAAGAAKVTPAEADAEREKHFQRHGRTSYAPWTLVDGSDMEFTLGKQAKWNRYGATAAGAAAACQAVYVALAAFQ
jgi:hypothetical protein